MTETPPLTAKNLRTDQEVRWCPGCGDYSILANVQKAVAASGKQRHEHVFISGIGCAARFPFYMETFGFHTIHGRAPAIATGLAVARPELTVWVATGDGDSLSIGGNHFIHAIRRNVNLNLLLFNNEIYGLTKGQYSPTSRQGKVTKSTPMGSLDLPLSPARVAFGAGSSFFARVIDTDSKATAEILAAAQAHKGMAVIEILQNCVIFNDAAFGHITDKKTAKDNQLRLVHGEPLLFAGGTKGISMQGAEPVVVDVDSGADILVHNQDGGPGYDAMLASLDTPEFPAPLGILWQHERPSYETGVNDQVALAKTRRKDANDLHALLRTGQTWEVE
jgi:2-oxoglutarate ferredoxin oxidoreductase subunit beta